MRKNSGSIFKNESKNNSNFEDIKDEYRSKFSVLSITPENYIKIGLIYLRIQSGLPVILMGETGIGKTSLVRLLSNITDVKIRIFNVHAGITSENIN
jgi:midasin (ATPase involved in ribosome maturation)